MPTPSTTSARMPVLFVAHGAPILLDDAAWVAELRDWAARLPRPRAILILSAHWEAERVLIGATRPQPLIYDFYGFPQRFYELTYPAPGAPELAARVRDLLTTAGIPFANAPERGLDHGAYVPLVCMYEQADIPVLQISLPGLDAQAAYALGRALSPLRDEGVLLIGSGFLTHNLRFAFRQGVPQWARSFDAWIADVLRRRDLPSLLAYERAAPDVKTALPTTEHFVPLLFSVGAATEADPITFPIAGFWMDGAMTKRSVQLG